MFTCPLAFVSPARPVCLGLHYVEDVRVAELNVLGGGDGTDAFVIEGVSGVVACF